MTFGKYKGRHLDEVPGDYLTWLLREGVSRPWWLPAAVRDELDRRRCANKQAHDAPQTGVVVADALRRVFARLALKYHPDRNAGDDRPMAVVNETFELRKRELQL